MARCHQHAIKVTATPFPHSMALAIALSGFPHQRYICEGFPPRSPAARRDFFHRLARQRDLTVIMDTPYRLPKVLKEVSDSMPKREVFLACNLGSSREWCRRSLAREFPSLLPAPTKEAFVLCLGPC